LFSSRYRSVDSNFVTESLRHCILVRPIFDHRSCSGHLLVAAVDAVDIVKPNPTHHPNTLFGVVGSGVHIQVGGGKRLRGAVEATEPGELVLC
jgi:hypothetical protein